MHMEHYFKGRAIQVRSACKPTSRQSRQCQKATICEAIFTQRFDDIVYFKSISRDRNNACIAAHEVICAINLSAECSPNWLLLTHAAPSASTHSRRSWCYRKQHSHLSCMHRGAAGSVLTDWRVSPLTTNP